MQPRTQFCCTIVWARTRCPILDRYRFAYREFDVETQKGIPMLRHKRWTESGSKGRVKRMRNSHPLLQPTPSYHPPSVTHPASSGLANTLENSWECVISTCWLGPAAPLLDFQLNSDAQIGFLPALWSLCGRPHVFSRRPSRLNSCMVFHTQGVFLLPRRNP